MYKLESTQNGNLESLLDVFTQTIANSPSGMQELMVKAGENWQIPSAPRYAHFIRSGVVSHSICMQDGTTVSTHLGTAGELVELHAVLSTMQLSCRATVILPTRILRVPHRLVQRAFAEDSRFRSELTLALGLRSLKTAQLAACNAVHDLQSRLARYLYTLSLHSDVPLPITQETLAAELAVRRTSVCLVMHELRQRDVLAFSRGKIIILNRDRLAAHACECHQILGTPSSVNQVQSSHREFWNVPVTSECVLSH